MRTAAGLFVFALAALGSAACVQSGVSVNPITTPDGKPAFAVDATVPPAKYWAAAAKKCPGGYDVLEHVDARDRWTSSKEAKQAVADNGPTHDDIVTIRCHGAPSSEPEKDPFMMSNAEYGAYLWREGHKDAGASAPREDRENKEEK